MHQPNFSRYDFTLCFAKYIILNVIALKKLVWIGWVTVRVRVRVDLMEFTTKKRFVHNSEHSEIKQAI